jgi:hypothetical protein
VKDVTRFNQAKDLPDQWDQLAGCYFQQREFLAHCEIWNPCRQRYYMAWENGKAVAGAVLYSLRLSLLTYAKLNLPVTMQIVGVPCSVSCSGLIGSPDRAQALHAHLQQREKGLLLALNLESAGQVPQGVAATSTLPTLTLEHSFKSWPEYLAAMRSDYRRRIRNILVRSDELQIRQQPCDVFTTAHHDLYLQVLGRSDAKLEQLERTFFSHLPDAFEMLTAERDGRLAGWAIVLNAAEGYYFFLGGVDHAEDMAHDVYLRLLVEVARHGIESGARRIDLGQTAEIPKLRLGGQCHPLYLGATHSNSLCRSVLKHVTGLLGYRRQVPLHHVFGGSS